MCSLLLSPDSHSQVTPLPSGVKHDDATESSTSGSLDEDDALPTYCEVVDGAMVGAQVISFYKIDC